MKCKIPEISWHNRDPVLSVDIQPAAKNALISGGANATYRLASGGTDSHVLIWYLSIINDGSDIDLDLAADLSRHQRAVNVVKWSPNGDLLASGDDESVVFVWKQKAENDPLNILENTNDQDKEIWITLKVLRGHMEDIYDLSWSPNSLFLVSGSVDNSAIIWDVHKGKSLAILNDHKGFVQGVTWDPKNQYIATLSTDRYLRIFDIQTKRVVHRINKGSLPVAKQHELHGRRINFFHDDTLQTFFRRLSFTPDGKLLITPSGVAEYEGATRVWNTTYAFSRYALKQPSIVLPNDQYTVAVRCCPLLFRLRAHDPINPPIMLLPYRMIFAVATRTSVYFYDTQQRQPFALISNIHYTRLTDITWSSDGHIVVVSSTDGFCSLITFEKGELGEEYEESETVLSAVLLNEAVPATGKKSKKQREKENDPQTPKQRSSTTEEASSKTLINAVGEEIYKEHIKRSPLLKEDEAKLNKFTKNKDSTIPSLKENVILSVSPPKDMDAEQSTVVSTISGKLLTSDVIIDKEILSSEEKFVSPDKGDRPATPIMVRRFPRTPTGTPPTSSNRPLTCGSVDNSPSASIQKRATPISIRRTPRALIVGSTSVDTPSMTEEAMDAWPLDENEILPVQTLTPKKVKNEVTSKQTVISQETTTEHTEDIRLVYEGTVTSGDELSNQLNAPYAASVNETLNLTDTPAAVHTPKQNQQLSNNITPRRVELKQISTPKSKKLLEYR